MVNGIPKNGICDFCGAPARHPQGRTCNKPECRDRRQRETHLRKAEVQRERRKARPGYASRSNLKGTPIKCLRCSRMFNSWNITLNRICPDCHALRRQEDSVISGPVDWLGVI